MITENLQTGIHQPNANFGLVIQPSRCLVNSHLFQLSTENISGDIPTAHLFKGSIILFKEEFQILECDIDVRVATQSAVLFNCRLTPGEGTFEFLLHLLEVLIQEDGRLWHRRRHLAASHANSKSMVSATRLNQSRSAHTALKIEH